MDNAKTLELIVGVFATKLKNESRHPKQRARRYWIVAPRAGLLGDIRSLLMSSLWISKSTRGRLWSMGIEVDLVTPGALQRSIPASLDGVMVLLHELTSDELDVIMPALSDRGGWLWRVDAGIVVVKSGST